jgi:hypothetical protein
MDVHGVLDPSSLHFLKKYRSSPIQLKREPVLFLKRFYFSVGSTNQGSSLRPNCPLPGQKSLRLGKKGGGSSFPDAGCRRFSPVTPLPPRLFAETERGELRSFSRPFSASAPAFLPGQQENGSERPTNFEMIQEMKVQVAQGFPNKRGKENSLQKKFFLVS